MEQNYPLGVNPSNKFHQLMLTSEPCEDFNQQFLQQSLSEGCFSIDILKVGRRESPNHTLNKIDLRQSNKITNLITSQTNGQKSPSPNRRNNGTFQFSNSTTPRYQQHSTSMFVQFFVLRRFATRLQRSKIMNNRFREYHFNLINDLGAVLNIQLFQDHSFRFKKIMRAFSQIQQSSIQQWRQKSTKILMMMALQFNKVMDTIPILNPDSKYKFIWDGFMIIPRLYFLLVIPLDLSFQGEYFLFQSFRVTTVISLLMLIADFLLSLNTAYYRFGTIVKDRIKIAAHTISKNGTLDFISLIAIITNFIAHVQSSQSNSGGFASWYSIVMISFGAQFRNITVYFKQAEDTLNLNKPASSLLELFKLISSILYVLHIFAGIWFWVGKFSLTEWDISWLYLKDVAYAHWTKQYLYSLYFSTVTMFTVGYGDITPQSDLERIIAILFMMVCSIQLSYSVSTVSDIIHKLSTYEDQKHKHFQTINSWMQKRKISYALQYQIREYLGYYWDSQMEDVSAQENTIFSQLSENLRETLFLEANSLLINNCELFKNHFSEGLKRELIKDLKLLVIQPESRFSFEKLAKDLDEEGDLFQNYVCFIENGSVDVYLERESSEHHRQVPLQVIQRIGEGQCIGLTDFLLSIPTKQKFRSIGFTRLLILSRKSFMSVIKNFPDDFQRYMQMKEQLQHFRTSELYKIECQSCFQKNHDSTDCPMLFYKPDKELIIKRFIYSRAQKRNELEKIKRKNRRSHYNSLLDKNVLSEVADNFQNDHVQEISLYEIDEEDPLHKQRMLQSLRSIDSLDVDRIRSPLPPNHDSYQQKTYKSILINQQIQIPKPKLKLQRAVQKIKQIHSFVKKSDHQKHTEITLIDLRQKEREIKQYERMQYAILQSRTAQFKNASPIFQKDILNAEFLILKLSMLINNEENLKNFDALKNYKFYYPQHNSLVQTLRFHTQQNNHQDLLSQLTKYLLFPFDYIVKFRQHERNTFIDDVIQNETQRKRGKSPRHLYFTKRAQIRPV